jgi:integrase
MGYADQGRGRRLKLPEYVNAYIDRSGRPRHYFRRAGIKQVSLPGLPWSTEFMEAHAAALAAWRQPAAAPIGADRTAAGTVNAAVVAYYARGLASLGQGSHAGVRSLIERFRAEHGTKRLRKLEAVHLQAYISGLQSAAVQRNMLRALRHFLKFAKAAGLIATDPSTGVTRERMKSSGGFVPWNEDHAARFEAHHKIGSMARAAYELYLNLGVRKSDVVRIGPGHVRDGVLNNFLPKKTSTTGGKRISIKLFASTKAAIDALPVTGTETYLVTSFGKPFGVNGFGNKMREWCDAAGLPPIVDANGKSKNLASHGLRKLFMIRLVHAGYSAPQIAALSGHKDLREIQTYIDEFDRQKVGLETSTAFEQVQIKNKIGS